MRLLGIMARITLLLSGIAAALAFGYFHHIVYTPQTINADKFVLVKNGDSLTNIASELKRLNLIKEEWHFLLFARINKIYPKIKAGEYLINKDVSLYDISKILTSGNVYMRKITFAEGLLMREIADILYENEYLEGDFILPTEGNFLPETYVFTRGDSREQIVKRGQKEMADFLQKAWNERDVTLPLKSKKELLILASIVEKETGVAAERPQVASVFVNRLKKGMLLQTDPTVIYALTLGKKDLERKLTRNDLSVDSPYNTYKYAGLPPKPICNPGKASILAAAHPDTTPYLYFVASGNGGHNFSRTLEEHNSNVRKWKKLSK